MAGSDICCWWVMEAKCIATNELAAKKCTYYDFHTMNSMEHFIAPNGMVVDTTPVYSVRLFVSMF